MIDLTVINRLPWCITYEYKGFRLTYENNQNRRIARIYQDGQLRCWASDLAAAVRWIDESCPRVMRQAVKAALVATRVRLETICPHRALHTLPGSSPITLLPPEETPTLRKPEL